MRTFTSFIKNKRSDLSDTHNGDSEVDVHTLLPLLLGTLLNPLNSSLIAIALIPIQRSLGVEMALLAWLVSAYYIAAAIGQTLMGWLVDQWGPRRLFLWGMALITGSSLLVVITTNPAWLIVIRVIQGVGTSAAYPAALVSIRNGRGKSFNPNRTLAVLAVTASTSAALGPVVGGLLISMVGWQAVFLINVPLAGIAAALAIKRLPSQDTNKAANVSDIATEPSQVRKRLDVLGMILFAAAMTTTLWSLLSFEGTQHIVRIVLGLALIATLIMVETRHRNPFIDVRELRRNKALSFILLEQTATNIVFYSAFFGLPMWLQAAMGFSSGTSGLLMLPIVGVSIIITPVTVRYIDRFGASRVLKYGVLTLILSATSIQLLTDTSTMLGITLIAVLLGLPNGLINLALQSALIASVTQSNTGAASGLFQTCRYIGASFATAILAVTLQNEPTTQRLHQVALVMSLGAVIMLALHLLGTKTRSPASLA